MRSTTWAGVRACAEDLLGQLPAARRNDVGLQAELLAKLRQLGGGVRGGVVDPPHVQSGHEAILESRERRPRLVAEGPGPADSPPHRQGAGRGKARV